jgi:hypothetical protein
MERDEIRAQLRNGGHAALAALLSDDQLDRVLAAPSTHKRQPLARLLRASSTDAGLSDGHAAAVLQNTSHAVSVLARDAKWQSWLAKHVDEACRVKDYENVAATLGEIRAAGALLDARLDISPVPTRSAKTADFDLVIGDHEACVEVFTRNMHAEEASALKTFRSAPGHTGPGDVIVREHWVHPFGRQRNGETVAQNVAQKLAGKKPRAEQVAEQKVALLWMDLQDEDCWTLGVSDAVPVRLNHEELWSSGVWHAYYGRRDTPIFEGHAIGRRALREPKTLGFDGAFHASDKWSAVLLAFASGCVVFENPTARHSLSNELSERLLSLLGFDSARSWMSYPAFTRLRRVPRALRDLLARRDLRWRLRGERLRLEDWQATAPYRW